MGKARSGVFILNVGDEVLDGRIQNTHATWFGEQLRLAGIPVTEARAVADRVDEIAAALRAANKQQLVIVTGGLGPTNDDRTLEGVRRAFQLPLAATKASLAHLRSRYRARGVELTNRRDSRLGRAAIASARKRRGQESELTPARLKLALVPKGARVLANSTGTAPGIHLRRGGCDFFFLPGPPHECRPMFEKFVLPVAKRKLRSRRLVRREFWRTFGRGESAVYQEIQPLVVELEKRFPATVAVGVHISFPYIDITLEAWKAPGEKAPSPALLDEAAAQITRALGSLCFSRQRESLVESVAALLLEKKATVSTAESCTGGLVAKLFTDIPGSSAFFLGGAVTYANSAKETLLGVNKNHLDREGAVSETVVNAMAEGMRRKLGTDYALALSGVAGPGGGSPEKPVGTIYVALSAKGRTRSIRQLLLGGQGSRDQNRVLAAHLALNLLRDALRSELLGFVDKGIPVN